MNDLQIKTRVPFKAIEEILITAMEGGSNYWYFMDGESSCSHWLDKEIEEGRLKRNEDIHYKWMDAMFQGCPYKISIYDIEEVNEEGLDDAEVLGYLTMQSIADGLEEAQEKYMEQFSQHVPEYNNGDSVSADVLFQLMVMGGVTYG